MIRVLFFASVRDRLGVAEERLADVPSSIATLREQLASRGSPWDAVLGPDQHVLAAVNQDMAGADAPISDGDEIGFFPPVTGG
jgi:molybdopterin synthase sulfur carrier subunit